jgi:hypothetical protein
LFNHSGREKMREGGVDFVRDFDQQIWAFDTAPSDCLLGVRANHGIEAG